MNFFYQNGSSGFRNESAYICHYRDHWFSIRKLGHQWFNLNSILPGPELLSDTYLSLFLAQLQTDKYSIFIVVGDLPSCEADKILRATPLSPRHFRKVPTKKQEPEEEDEQLKVVKFVNKFNKYLHIVNLIQAALEMSWKQMEEEDDQEALNKAILQSLQTSQPTGMATAPVLENSSGLDDDLKRAISLSLSGEAAGATSFDSTSADVSTGAIADSVEFIRQRRLLRLGQLPTNNP